MSLQLSRQSVIPQLPRPRLKVNYFPEVDVDGVRGKMALCVKPFHNGWNKALWLVEFLEMYKLLGVHHFIMYNHTVGGDVERILEQYRQVRV